MSDVAGCPLFNRSVGADFYPFIELIVCIKLGGKACVSVFLAAYNTVIVNVIYRSKKMAFVVAVLECDRVLGSPASIENFLYPVCSELKRMNVNQMKGEEENEDN